jgi:hypothetical protein
MTMKVITSADLKLDTSLQPGKVYYQLGTHFCKPLHLMRQCTIHCQSCSAHIQNILNRIEETENPHDPYGLLVWSIREEIADIAEQSEEPQGPMQDWLGMKVDKNPFEALLEAL